MSNVYYFLKNYEITANGETYATTLTDGTNMLLDIWANDSAEKVGVTKNIILSGSSLGFMVDVNGNKKPNTVGKDIHVFILTERGIVPGGIDNNSKNCDNKKTNNNFDCTAKMLKG